MKYLLISLLLLLNLADAKDGYPDEATLQEYVPPTEDVKEKKDTNILKKDSSMTISVVGQGVAPSFTISPAQAYALAKRAATADAYRLIAEKINGVEVEGKDTVKNMVLKRSTVNTQVRAMIKNATLVETTFKDGLCEVEMEIRINYSQFN